MTFEEFFKALNNGREPFPWQRTLAQRAVLGDWPAVMALPTASGKTACIDIAVFALAIQSDLPPIRRTAARRVFFVVDRRVIVDEAYERMHRIARALAEAKSGVLREVADRLRSISGDPESHPLSVHELRGGIYRDNAWVENPAQPLLVASTVDQIGSRLLFRGYGVPNSTKPIHAALIANDALIILDEAHCSRPFGQTLRAVKSYREQGGVAQSVRLPFHVVEMTATPGGDKNSDIFHLTDDDRKTEWLGPRLTARKPAELVEARRQQGKSERESMAEELVRQALRLRDENPSFRNIVIFANRVATARAVYQKLKDELKERGCRAELMIGRMRPIDRDELTGKLAPRLRSGQDEQPADLLFVCSTQCLEVGADFDFDGLVTECASIDALRQRFGRLNRLGRAIDAQAVIVAPGKLNDDPVYGNSILHTWNWLKGVARVESKRSYVDFAIEGTGSIGEALDSVPASELVRMRKEDVDAPVLFREYIDIWSQTNPAPDPEPEIAYFLHGPDSDSAEVQLVWRADIEAGDEKDWAEIVSLCPPVVAESMAVPFKAFQKWIVKEGRAAEDIADIATPAKQDRKRPADRARPYLIWRGIRRSTREPSNLRAGDTVVVPASYGGWDELGYFPELQGKVRADRAEEAILNLRRAPVLRLHNSLLATWPNVPDELKEELAEEDPDRQVIMELLAAYRERLADGEWPKPILDNLGKSDRAELAPYPDGQGIVLRVKRNAAWEEDDGDDDLSAASDRLSLADHTGHVEAWAGEFAARCGLEAFAREFSEAARRHDWGKADERFQALLLGGDRIAARFSPKLWAKSGQLSLSRQERDRQRKLSELPEGFRHELLSLQLAESGKSPLGDPDLILHLIATHHGEARAFAPMVDDADLPAVTLRGVASLTWSKEERQAMPAPHRISSGITDRFWELTGRFGWWGLAWLETVFRLADWKASDVRTAPENKAAEKAA